MKNIEVLTVEDLPIRLGQLLKLANLVQDGFEAKIRIQYGEVILNGNVESRRGKKIHEGDIITYQEKSFQIMKKI